MTDNEILLALSNIIEPVRADILEIKGNVKNLEQQLQTLGESTDHKLQTLEESMDHKLQTLEESMSHRLRVLEATMDHRLRKIELTQENDILPRLRTIEACYTSTYERYKDSVEDYDMMKQDISLLKDVVTEHSQKLQMIS